MGISNMDKCKELSILYSALQPREGEYLPAYFYRVSAYANWLTPKELLSYFGASDIGRKETLLPYWIIRYAYSENQPLDEKTVFAQHTEFKFWQGYIAPLRFKRYLNSQLESHRTGRVLFKGESVLCKHKVVKGCPFCIAEDKSKFGFAYWRAHHQIPTIFTCQKHNQPLYQRATDHSNYSQKDFTNLTEIKISELHTWLERETKALLLLPGFDARQYVKDAKKRLSDTILTMPFKTHDFNKEWRSALAQLLQPLYCLSVSENDKLASALYLNPMNVVDVDSEVHPVVFLLLKYFISRKRDAL